MAFFDVFRWNFWHQVAEREEDFRKLLEQGDIQTIVDDMENRDLLIDDAMHEYNTFKHPINFRPDKIITDKKGNFVRKDEVWKLPISYPIYINEIALVFLYGQPVKWVQDSTETEEAYNAFIQVIKKTRFNSKIRECKRLAGAETQSAMLFHVFKNKEGKADVQIRVLAKSKGDDIRVKWDCYENIISIAWGYYVKENEHTVHHYDIFTNETVYRCKQGTSGWQVEEEENLIGKIPIILFQQEKEWAGVEPLLHRLENIISRTADTNDYFADPIAILDAEIIKNLPESKDTGKLLVTSGGSGVDSAARYLTWDSAPQSKKDEIEYLEEKIHMMTFTPKISLDTLKSVSQLSGKALKTVMLLADMKASRRKETHEELLDRTASLITAIIANVLNVSLYKQCQKLSISHEFQEPFGEDISTTISQISQLYNDGLLSLESAIERNPFVKNPIKEKERLQAQEEQNKAKSVDLFSGMQ